MDRIDSNIETELHDVFYVTQITRDTPIEEAVGADLVRMDAGKASQTHRHNFSETVLFFSSGKATVFVDDVPHNVKAGDRLLVRKAEFHSVSTPKDSGCEFLSVQTPPILTKATGFRDLETREEAEAAAAKNIKVN
ncbi:MAG: cupin domain-containing protein [Alphaproteobacteria bacterium]